MSRQSPCGWNRSQCLMPYTSRWKDSQDCSCSTDWLMQHLFHLFLKATVSQRFIQHLPHVSRNDGLTPSPSAFGICWTLESRAAHGTQCLPPRCLRLQSSSGPHAEKGTTNSKFWWATLQGQPPCRTTGLAVHEACCLFIPGLDPACPCVRVAAICTHCQALILLKHSEIPI